MSRLLICKDAEQNTLLETRTLKETDNIRYSIIENPPEIEEKDGYKGFYVLVNGEVQIVYEEIQKVKTNEELEEEIKVLNQAITELSMIMASTIQGGDTNDI